MYKLLLFYEQAAKTPSYCYFNRGMCALCVQKLIKSCNSTLAASISTLWQVAQKLSPVFVNSSEIVWVLLLNLWKRLTNADEITIMKIGFMRYSYVYLPNTTRTALQRVNRLFFEQASPESGILRLLIPANVGSENVA
ncbi:MAG: hypothetical protein E7503_04345 [Ruminococcus sp.]|nr:hypothetical protein [Ruminococcus sp.]